MGMRLRTRVRLYVISCLTVLAAVLSSTLLFLEKCLHHRASLAKWFDRRFSDSDSLQQWGNMANEDRIGRVGGGGANGRCVCVYVCVCVCARARVIPPSTSQPVAGTRVNSAASHGYISF